MLGGYWYEKSFPPWGVTVLDLKPTFFLQYTPLLDFTLQRKVGWVHMTTLDHRERLMWWFCPGILFALLSILVMI